MTKVVWAWIFFGPVNLHTVSLMSTDIVQDKIERVRTDKTNGCIKVRTIPTFPKSHQVRTNKVHM